MTDEERGGHVWLASYPKSGNTWFRLLLANLLANADTPTDINRIPLGLIASSRRWLDGVLGFDTAELDFHEIDLLRPLVHGWSEKASRPCFVKTHDAFFRKDDGQPLFAGPGTRSAVYLIRSPLDVAVSYAHHNGESVDKTIAVMADPDHALSTTRRRLLPQIRQHVGSWSAHVSGWTEMQGSERLVVRYEDLVRDPQGEMLRAARFLELSHDAGRIARAVRFSDFSELCRQEADAGFSERPPGMTVFFRSGRVGGWRAALTDVQVARLIADHGAVMQRFGYLDSAGNPM